VTNGLLGLRGGGDFHLLLVKQRNYFSEKWIRFHIQTRKVGKQVVIMSRPCGVLDRRGGRVLVLLCITKTSVLLPARQENKIGHQQYVWERKSCQQLSSAHAQSYPPVPATDTSRLLVAWPQELREHELISNTEPKVLSFLPITGPIFSKLTPVPSLEYVTASNRYVYFDLYECYQKIKFHKI
jgi:hypothetical protein